ncbi:MAG: 1-deoxy-D-xylulose-5-phosphate synthase, partial [Aeromonas sp.]
GDIHNDMLVVLNDNEMSISQNVGALNKHLARLMSGKIYTTIREGGKKVLAGLPPVKELAKRAEEHLKGMVIPGTLFEEFGFNYIGPIDGHDINALVETLSNMRGLKGPQLLHIKTTKGKGYQPAEADPTRYHAVPKFDLDECDLPRPASGKATFSDVFGQWLCDMAAADPRLIGITPAMCEGSGMVPFSQQYPERYFDVAIAEQHAVTFAAGLALAGQRPVIAIYSSFLQRAYDQVIHDMALQDLPMLLAIDRAGLVGADGPTHQGAYDISFLRTVPNLIVMTPSDENECRQLLSTGFLAGKPAAVRYPRGSSQSDAPAETSLEPVEIGRGRVLRQSRQQDGTATAILAFGSLLHQAKAAAEALDATLVDMRFVKPLDEALVLELAATHAHFVTLEDNAIMGGAGSAVIECLMANKQPKVVLQLGLPDRFIEQGTQAQIYAKLGLDSDGILSRISAWLKD